MPRPSDMIPSKFLKKEDVGAGVLVTIAGLSEANVAAEGAEPEMKWTMHFKELDKPLVLNGTNIHIMESFLGAESTDAWVGKQVVLYNDPTITYKRKLTGGIRVRPPRTEAAPKEDLPF